MAIYGFVCTVIAAGLTAFYSWRLIFMTFYGRPHDQHHYEAAHEAPLTMLVPLGVLAAGSLVAGLAFHEVFTGHAVERILPQFARLRGRQSRPRGHAPRRRRGLGSCRR